MSITQKEFLKQNGGLCPNCQGGNIEFAEKDIDGNTYWQKVICHNCEADWTEYYHLAGYDSLNVPPLKSRQEKYIESEGTRCPHCGNQSLVGMEANPEIGCTICHSTWIEIRPLTGFKNLLTPKEI